jgi:outer membrane biosynthesis protein TonB
LKLIDYIQGNRRGKEANRLERKAMNDLFLNDAIDGFDAVNDNHIDAIQQLENRLKLTVVSKRKSNNNRWRNLSIAASIALLIGVGGFIFTKYQAPSNLIVSKTVKPNQPIIIAENKVPQAKPTAPMHSKTVSRKPILATPIAEKTDTLEVAENINSVNESISVADVKASSDMQVSDIADIKIDTELAKGKVLNNASFSGSNPNVFGRIVDEKGKPIFGATILIQGTSKGVVTDTSGKFELKIPNEKLEKTMLVANYIGYYKKEFPAISLPKEITLNPNNLALNEVVVVAYGSQKRTSTLGSISSIAKPTMPFGEKEFIQYFEKNKKSTLCEGAKGKIKASFYIDKAGKPTDIEITKSLCDEADEELIRLLNSSPRWTKTDRKEKLSIKL